MNFELDKEYVTLREMYRSFAVNEVKPIAEEIDEEERFPVETVEKLKRYGFLGIPYPKEYGGAGGDNLAFYMAVEELSKACASTAAIINAHNLCSMAIFDNGTEEQKQKYFVPLASGKMLGAMGMTEPGAGSDVGGARTRATLDGEEYVLNGSKIFITNAGQADVYVILARTDENETYGTRGLSTFIVDANTPGFTVGKHEKTMGIRASAEAELIFDNCRIPKENLLGKLGKGFGICMKTLDGGRIGVAAQAVGLAQGAIDATVSYVKERKIFGKTLDKFQNTQFKLADMQTKTEVARLMLYKAARCKDAKKPFSKEAAMAKLFASDIAMEVTREAIQLHGGYGYVREYPVERMMRDAKITEIYEGTSEVLRMVISANML